MTDILSVIKEAFPGQYDYLRLGIVKLNEKRLNATFLVPEDIYDYHLTSDDIHNIKDAVSKAVGTEYSVTCQFEKIILSQETVRSALAEYLAKYFPLIAANLDFSRVTIDLAAGLSLAFTVQKNIRDYMVKVDFDKKVKDFFYQKYSLDVVLAFSVVEDAEITFTAETAMDSGRYGKTVTVTDKTLLMGKLSDLHAPAVHISTLRGEGEEVVCCGKINYLSFKTRDESKKAEYKKFFKHYYTFSISDTTGYLNIFINTDDEFGALQNGAEVVCKGRVNAREESTNYSMYVKSIALCKIPFSTIAEQTKPLDPPKEYSVLFPKEYQEVTYDQIGFDFLTDRHEKKINTTANCVSLAVRALKTERAVVPYEVAMCSVEKGKIKEYIHTFLRVAFTEDSDKAEYANRMGYAAPRLSTVIPDLLKFSADRLIVGVNPAAALELFNKIAKPLRYSFANDVHVVQQSALKYEGEKKGDALEEAIAAANAFIFE